MKSVRGHIFRARKSWHGRWWREELEKDAEGNSRVVRRQHAEKLCAVGDRYHSKKDVQPLLDGKLRSQNEGRTSPESTLPVAKYGDDFFMPYADRELKKSTAYSYRGLWRMYLKPRLENIAMKDFRCVDATNLLASIHADHRLSRKSLRHCKGLLSTIFTHAKRAGVLDGENPAQDAGIPRAAVNGRPTYAYSPQEVILMLDVLSGVARTAVALMYFCGLRPGEARAAQGEEYDSKKKTLRIRASMWRTHLTEPKTPESVAPVPVAETLAEILADTRRDSGFILASPTGKPVDLHNLAYRIIVPRLTACANCGKPKKGHDSPKLRRMQICVHEYKPKPLPEWRGWYAFRRGCATLATSLDSSMAAKSLLRHSNAATTESYYIKSVATEAIRAVEKMDALFQKGSDSTPI
jgi:integrase